MKRYKQKEYLEDKYWKHNLSIEQIAKEEGVDKGTIFYWMKKLGVKRRTDSEALMIHHPNRIKLPKMNEDLAYALGVIFGDGCAYYGKTSWYVQLTTTSETFNRSFENALRKLGYTVTTGIEKRKTPSHWKTQWRTYACSIELVRWVKELKKDINKLTELIETKEYAIAFLRGFYESEGSLKRNGAHSVSLTMSNTNKHLVEFVRELIEKLGFKVSVYTIQKKGKRRTAYEIYLLGAYKEKLTFLEIIKPCIKNKINVNFRVRTRGRYPKEVYLQALEMRRGGASREEIMNALNIPKSTFDQWIYLQRMPKYDSNSEEIKY